MSCLMCSPAVLCANTLLESRVRTSIASVLPVKHHLTNSKPSQLFCPLGVTPFEASSFPDVCKPECIQKYFHGVEVTAKMYTHKGSPCKFIFKYLKKICYGAHSLFC